MVVLAKPIAPAMSPSQVVWTAAAGGDVPAGAVVGGFEANGTPLYVCRASYSGGVLQLTTRYTLINLASHGFNNDTSSYRVGPCAATFYDTTTGSGVYPGSTAANVSKATMSSGWDNRIGSVYIA